MTYRHKKYNIDIPFPSSPRNLPKTISQKKQRPTFWSYLWSCPYFLRPTDTVKQKGQERYSLLPFSSGGWDRTNDLVINSHPLFR